ncbi:unnamed protein product, partial [Effrenium voratum]
SMLGALLVAMAFRSDATPGRYATEAMEHSGGDPGGSGEGLMSCVQEANVRAFRQKHGLMQDSDFGFAFEAFEDAVTSSPLNGCGCGRSNRLTSSRQARQWWRQNPDNAEAVGRRVNLLTEAKLGVLRPRRYDDPTFQELSLFLAARGVQDPEELDFHAFLEQAMSPSRALQSLRWLSNNGRLQWQLDRLKPPKVIGKVRKDYQGLAPEQHDKCGICFHPASGQAWPIREVQRVTQHLFHGVSSSSLAIPGGDCCRLGSLIRLQDAEIVSLGDWQDKVEERVSMPFHYSGGKYALSMRTKMRAFLVAAKVADCEAWETVTKEEIAEADEEAKIKAAQACRGDTEVIWAQAPQTTALKRRFSLSQSLVHNARERMRKPAPSARAMPSRLGEIFLTGHLKNGTALCPDFNT